VYKILGSADFLGNPVGLFSNIGTGVMDFFYEPVCIIFSSKYVHILMLGKRNHQEPSRIWKGISKGKFELVKAFDLWNI
jgi:hypothetical protein